MNLLLLLFAVLLLAFASAMAQAVAAAGPREIYSDTLEERIDEKG